MWKKLHNNRMNLCQQAWYHFEKNKKVAVFLNYIFNSNFKLYN